MTHKYDYLDYFRDVPKTGVIYVLEKAYHYGFSNTNKKWANLGQGAPDTAPIDENATPLSLNVTPLNSEYAPVSGELALRKKIADYYNKVFRSQKASKYTYKNVCISGGGRVALSRLVAAMGNINLGHFIPDYTAYEELLSVFRSFVPIPINLKPENNFKISIDELKVEIVNKGLSSLLISNPCNPTGQSLQSGELQSWISLLNELRCLGIFDEFYSHFLYNSKSKTNILSAAEFIDDVNNDPIVIINGMSKNWRSPGWRIGWMLAPEPIIQKVSSVGSFFDGGAVHPLQEAALSIINPDLVENEAAQLQDTFIKKRDYFVKRVRDMGIQLECEPDSTFYLWCNLSGLPEPLNNCLTFFEECLKENVIVVPGIFFDVNPGKRRLKQHSRYMNNVRLSYGPSFESLVVGLDNIQRVIDKFSR